MARANFQVSILPFCIVDGAVKYGVFHRSDMDIWQFIAGGGEDDETPIEAAKREAFEEAAISAHSTYYGLDTVCSIPGWIFKKEDRQRWGKECLVIPEYSFCVRLEDADLVISDEHTHFEWLAYEDARDRLRYDSNRTALWELRQRIAEDMLGTQL